jgi:DNA-binding response OmpR family regulator
MQNDVLEQAITKFGALDADKLQEAVQKSKASGVSLEESLLLLGYTTLDELGKIYAKVYNLPYVSITQLKAEQLPLNILSKEQIKRYEVVPLAYRKESRTLTISTWRPDKPEIAEGIKQKLPPLTIIRLTVASKTELRQTMQRIFRIVFETPSEKPAPNAANVQADKLLRTPADDNLKIKLSEDFTILEETSLNQSEISLDQLKKMHGSSNVLVVEPDHKIRNPLRSFLESYHYNVDISIDDRSAIEMLDQKRYNYLVRRRVTESRSRALSNHLEKMRSKELKLCLIDELDKLILGASISYAEMSEGYLNTATHLIKLFLSKEKNLLDKTVLMSKYARLIAMRLNMPKPTTDGLIVSVYLCNLGQSATLQKLLTGSDSAIDPNHVKKSIADLFVSLKTPYSIYETLAGWAKLSLKSTENVNSEAKILHVIDFFIDQFGVESLVKGSKELKGEMIDSLRGKFKSDELSVIAEALIKILSDEAFLGEFEAVKRTILVIDKDITPSSELYMRLRNDGYEIQQALNAKEGLGLINKKMPDLIISETDIGDTDGFALCRLLKQDGRTRRVPFMFLSNAGDPGAAAEGLRSGADDYITKPYSAELVGIKISRALARLEQADTTAGVYGRLEDMSFIEIIQILSGSARNACVTLKHEHRQGKVFIEEGNIIHAFTGKTTGEQAIYLLMQWKEGEFTIEPLKDKINRVIFESTENILLEGCRIMDEAEQ